MPELRDLSLDVVVSTRVRFARNLVDYPFGGKLEGALLEELLGRITDAAPDLTVTELVGMDKAARLSLAEKHRVSPEFALAEGRRLLLTDEEGHLAVMAPEEDHLRIQSIYPGFSPDEAYETAKRAERRFAAALPFAFDGRLGYLTHCPTNLGTAMRLSAMVFLPGLRQTRGIEKLLPALGRLGFTIRGMYGEGSRPAASLYQISNQVTMGVTEGETLEKCKALLAQVVDLERQARDRLFAADPVGIADRALRAYGILRYAKKMSSAEFGKHYETLRLCAGRLPEEEIPADPGFWDSLFEEIQPAALTVAGAGNESERDLRRAALLRETLRKGETNGE